MARGRILEAKGEGLYSIVMDRGWDRLAELISRVSDLIEELNDKLVDARAELAAFEAAGNTALVAAVDDAMQAYATKVEENCTPEGMELDPVRDELNELQLAGHDFVDINERLAESNTTLARLNNEKTTKEEELISLEEAEKVAEDAMDDAQEEVDDAYSARYECTAEAVINGKDPEVECYEENLAYLMAVDAFNATVPAYVDAYAAAEDARQEIQTLADEIAATEGTIAQLVIDKEPITARFQAAMDAYNKALTTQLLAMRKCEPMQFVNEVVAIEKAVLELATWRTERQLLDNKVKMLTMQWTSAQNRLFYYQNVTQEMTITRDAWCTDYTVDIAEDTEVATCEVPNEPQNVIIAAGGRAPVDLDGKLLHRYVHSAAQLFFNVATLPGWQKWKPMYRVGVITSINYDDDTASVELDEARSSATGEGPRGSPTTGQDWDGPPGDPRGLKVNQDMPLDQIPVVYMECNADAFEVGDRVLVEFVDQEWDNARVIGFETNPRECIVYPDMLYPTLERNDYLFDGPYPAGLGVYAYVNGKLTKVIEAGNIEYSMTWQIPGRTKQTHMICPRGDVKLKIEWKRLCEDDWSLAETFEASGSYYSTGMPSFLVGIKYYITQCGGKGPFDSCDGSSRYFTDPPGGRSEYASHPILNYPIDLSQVPSQFNIPEIINVGSVQYKLVFYSGFWGDSETPWTPGDRIWRRTGNIHYARLNPDGSFYNYEF